MTPKRWARVFKAYWTWTERYERLLDQRLVVNSMTVRRAHERKLRELVEDELHSVGH